jgi:hypothetical protein
LVLSMVSWRTCNRVKTASNALEVKALPLSEPKISGTPLWRQARIVVR